MSIGGSHLSKTDQDPLVKIVTLLRDMLQNLSELNRQNCKVNKLGLSMNTETTWTYHALFNIIILCHLDESLEQSAVVLDEYVTGLPISTLNPTVNKKVQ